MSRVLRRRVAPHLRRTPLPHQSFVIQATEGSPSVALFLEMRLGKTLSIIRWALRFSVARILVVAPLSTLSSWRDELEQEQVHRSTNIIMLVGSKKQRLALFNEYDRGWFLINYEGLRACHALTTSPWDIVILDESTRIRNPRAAITKICLGPLRLHSDRRAIMSGLPAPESPLDYWCQMAFLHGQFLGFRSWWAMRRSLFVNAGFEWYPKAGVIGRIKREVHKRAIVMTRKQAGIGSAKVYERRVVQPTVQQKRLTREIDKDLEATIGTRVLTTKWITTKMIWLARLAGGFDPEQRMVSSTKMRELRSLLLGELKEEQVVVWFRFNRELEVASAWLENAGITHTWMTGETKLAQRHELRLAFNKRKYRVLLMQIKIGRVGLDFSGASTAIYYSTGYDNEDRSQSEDRIIHPKKKEPLLYIDLVTAGSIDEEISQVMRDKRFSSRFFMTRVLERRFGCRSISSAGSVAHTTRRAGGSSR